jgi:opacity protein-like surface antigen
MRVRASLAIAMLVLAAVSFVAAGPADAEWAIDLFGGVSWTKSADVDVSGRDNIGVSTDATFSDVEIDRGFTAGARIGYWLESLPFLGFGVDAFFFSLPVPAQTVSASSTFSGSLLGKPITFNAAGDANIPSVDLPGVAFSPQLMLRLPLFVSEDAPKGRLQPYLGGGPAWAFTIESDELALILGGLVRAGVAVQVFKFLALFAEYRYSFFPGFKVKDEGLTFKADLNTSHVVGGLSFRF